MLRIIGRLFTIIGRLLRVIGVFLRIIVTFVKILGALLMDYRCIDKDSRYMVEVASCPNLGSTCRRRAAATVSSCSEVPEGEVWRSRPRCAAALPMGSAKTYHGSSENSVMFQGITVHI